MVSAGSAASGAVVELLGEVNPGSSGVHHLDINDNVVPRGYSHQDTLARMESLGHKRNSREGTCIQASRDEYAVLTLAGQAFRQTSNRWAEKVG